eukprot:299242-Amphidinium_carterae.1
MFQLSYNDEYQLGPARCMTSLSELLRHTSLVWVQSSTRLTVQGLDMSFHGFFARKQLVLGGMGTAFLVPCCAARLQWASAVLSIGGES